MNFHHWKSYVKHFFTSHSRKGHGIHSPFVFRFTEHVLRSSSLCFPLLEKERHALYTQKTIIAFTDHGTGTSEPRRISKIARKTLASKKDCRILSALIHFVSPACCLELGTSLGITTAYMASALPGGTIFTIEGCGEVLRHAMDLTRRQQLNNIIFLHGTFDSILPALLPQLPKPFLAFVDGNHSYTPTLSYFNALAGEASPESVIVIHDIHLNKQMEKAWEAIKHHPLTIISIDLFSMGIIFFRKGLQRQHFRIRV